MSIDKLIMRRVYWYIAIACINITVISVLVYQLTHTTTWQVVASDDTVTNYAPTLHALERSRALGTDTWFRHIRNQSDIAIPNSTSPQIITLSVLLRSDNPPTALGIRTTRHTLWIYRDALTAPRTAQLRRVMWYGQPNERYVMYCNNAHITDPYIQPLCTGFVSARGDRIGDLNVNRLVWLLLPIISWITLGIVSIHKLTQRMWHRALAVCGWVGAGVHIWWLFPLQIESWRNEISFICLVGVVIIAFIPQRRQTWLLTIFILAMITRIGGYVVPGSPGTDRIIHVQQLHNIMTGNLYQVNQGLIVINDITKQQPQVYPYPPVAYLSMVPFTISFDSIVSDAILIGIIAIVFEGFLIIMMAHVMQRLRFSQIAIRIAVIIGLWLPQAYVLHVYTTAAQSIGQTFAWIGVFLALVGSAASQRRKVVHASFWSALATASHIGVFVTMSAVHVWAWVIQRGRIVPAFIGWIIGTVLVWVLFYSQYFGLITEQVDTLIRKDRPNWQDELSVLWYRGIDDHYSWIVVMLMVLAWGISSIQKRPMLRTFYGASILMVMTFIIFRVVFQVNPTRFIIFVAPLVALGAGVFLARITQHRAGRMLAHALIGYLAYISLVQWYTMMIAHQLQRWYTPQ
ncbi:MAG: hypothetical protein RI985_691 [Chloroflexota bacterium]|jgi:hypothetical protein